MRPFPYCRICRRETNPWAFEQSKAPCEDGLVICKDCFNSQFTMDERSWVISQQEAFAPYEYPLIEWKTGFQEVNDAIDIYRREIFRMMMLPAHLLEPNPEWSYSPIRKAARTFWLWDLMHKFREIMLSRYIPESQKGDHDES